MICGMNSKSSRPTYGILPLTSANVREIQLGFAMIETPAPRSRFLNFPLADEALSAEPARTIRREKRSLAA